MIKHIRSGSPYEDRWGFTRAVRFGDRVIVSGTAPIPPPGEEVASTPYEQMMRCGEIIRAALKEAGVTMADVVRTRMFVTSEEFAEDIGRAHKELFGEAMPAATMIKTQLIDPTWMVEVEAEAVVPPQ
ncbi:MAG: RidA family protein [Acidimicrobiia bacterium]|nr:RidA family protein [Acidimicrobiia bacterium]